MTPLEQVESLLHTVYGWIDRCAPEPAATEKQLQVSTPEQVAYFLDAYVRRIVAYGRPAGYSFDEGYQWAVRGSFTKNQEYWGHFSQLAFGQVVEIPVDTIGPARSESEWYEHHAVLRNYLGEKLCAADEMERRKKWAQLTPPEWMSWPAGPRVYQLGVQEGHYPVGMKMWDSAYLQCPLKIDDVRGLDPTQVLDNLHADQKGVHRAWLPGGQPNPEGGEPRMAKR